MLKAQQKQIDGLNVKLLSKNKVTDDEQKMIMNGLHIHHLQVQHKNENNHLRVVKGHETEIYVLKEQLKIREEQIVSLKQNETNHLRVGHETEVYLLKEQLKIREEQIIALKQQLQNKNIKRQHLPQKDKHDNITKKKKWKPTQKEQVQKNDVNITTKNVTYYGNNDDDDDELVF